MKQGILKARAHKIRPRPLELAIPDDLPRYWMDGDPYSTHLLNALSVTFPPGERLFMAAVRALRHKVEDPALKEQIKAFLAQEALHSREHSSLNAWLTKVGYPADKFEQEVADDIAQRRSARGPFEDLAVTCALEHFTAIMAESWLKHPELRERCHKDLRALWLWHAIEELDHKAVAFDVYQAAGGQYALRAATMVFVTIGLIGGISIYQAQLMAHDNEHKNLKSWAKGLWTYWGPTGYFVRLIPSYLRYFRRDFHPFDQDDSALLAAAETELSRLTGTAYGSTSADAAA
ncbi:MAG: metal-dependent hydrolase [Myxococcales bacterium]